MSSENTLISKYSHKREPRLVACNFRIKYNDIFSFKNLYKLMHEWVIDKNWSNAKTHEQFFAQKTDANKMNEYWIWWEIQKKGGQYYTYHFKIIWHCITMTKKEIMHEGKKFKADSGDVELKFRAWVEFNEEGWRSHWLLKHFPQMYRNRIFESNLEDYKRELYREVFQLQGIVKRYLNMKGFLPELELEPFHPSYSWPH